MDRPHQGWTARLLRLLIALQGWTVVGLALLYLDPGGMHARLECARRSAPSAACLAAQDIVTDAWRTLHFWPLLGVIGLGYVVIVAMFLRGARGRSRRGSASGRRAPATRRRAIARRAASPRTRLSRA